jgi:hypothetical protein
MKIDVNLLENEEISEEKSEEQNEELSEDISPDELKTVIDAESDSQKKVDEDADDSKSKKGVTTQTSGNGKKRANTPFYIVVALLVILIIVFLVWNKAEQVPGFLSFSKDTVLTIKPLESVTEEETPEFSIVPIEDEKASDTLKRIKQVIDGSSYVVPENITILKQQRAVSEERLKRFFVLSAHFPEGLFWSYYSNSANYELFEVKAAKVGVFETFFNRVMEKKLFKNLNFYSYDGKYWDSLEGVFAGNYVSEVKKDNAPLYTMSSEDFIDYVAHAAQKTGVNFTDWTVNKVESMIAGTEQSVFKLTLYGTVSQLSRFSNGLMEIPATLTVTKVIAGRRPEDSFPDPLKLILYVGLFEKK